jgi:hypothetical protein
MLAWFRRLFGVNLTEVERVEVELVMLHLIAYWESLFGWWSKLTSYDLVHAWWANQKGDVPPNRPAFPKAESFHDLMRLHKIAKHALKRAEVRDSGWIDIRENYPLGPTCDWVNDLGGPKHG